jgi:hypothetical protein
MCVHRQNGTTGQETSIVMNDTPIEPTSEAILISEVSDDALEAAADTPGPARASSFSFSSFHLSCC